MSEDDFQPVKSADRTLEVLETLARAQRPLSLGELAKSLTIPKSSLHGLLRTLQKRQWVEATASGSHFGLGVRTLMVGAAYVESSQSVTASTKVLDWLSDQLGETVHLGRLDGPDVIYLAKRESRHPLRLYSAVGRRLPAHSTALGKALLARRRTSELAAILSPPLVALTPHTITDLQDLHDELERIRQRGYSIDDEENAVGIKCFAIALDTAVPAQDAISLSIPTTRLTPDLEREVAELLMQAKQRLDASAVLGA